MSEIPGFQEMMLPVLQILSDGKEHSRQQLIREIADHFQLTKRQRDELLPSGKDTVVANRTTWVTVYLGKAGLILKPERSVFVITDEGKKLLKSPPTVVNIAFLKENFPAVATWLKVRVKGKDDKDSEGVDTVEPPVERTPEEVFAENYNLLRRELADELLEQIKSKPSGFFERLVVDLLLKMGYGGSHQNAGKVVGKSGDGGIDGIIDEDKLGLDTIYIQAKRYDSAVPISHIRDFAGTLSGKKTKKGIFITTSSFPQSAYEFVKTVDGRIVLIDGEQLAELMIDNNLGITTQYSYEIKRMDSDYFEDM
jgi:restriction system protein